MTFTPSLARIRQNALPIAVALTLFVLTPSAFAAESKMTYSGDITFTSNYIFRGTTQSDEKAAVQGGFVLDTGYGVSVGTWGSNVSYAGSSAALELDTFVTLGFDANETIAMEIGLLNYHYSGESALDYLEVVFGMAVAGFKLSIVTSDDYEASGSQATWLQGAYSFPLLTDKLSLSAEYGMVTSNDDIFSVDGTCGDDDPAACASSYSHLGVAVSLAVGSSSLTLTATSTDRDDGDTQTAISWSRSF